MPPHKNKINFDPHTKTKYLSTRTQNQVNSDTYNEVKSIPIPTIKWGQFSRRDTKTKSISFPTLKPSIYRPLH